MGFNSEFKGLKIVQNYTMYVNSIHNNYTIYVNTWDPKCTEK